MADGDVMIDADGDEILDDDGDLQLSDGAGDACCCGGKKCFQLWTAVWDCDTSTWTLTPGAFYCLSPSTSTAWTGSGCNWQRYVATTTDCTVDGDCSALANTATPAAPNGGARPSGCCTPAANCSHCTTSPQSIVVSFDGVEIAAAPCDNFCTYGTFESSGSLGTYALTQDPLDPCHWYATCNDVSWTTYSTYTTPGPCDPGGDTATYDSVRIDLYVRGTSSWKLTASINGPGFPTDPTGYLLFYSDSDPGPADCCTPFDVASIFFLYSCSNPAKGGTATITPSC